MGKLYIFGDIHFSALNLWSKLVGDKFIFWFKNHFENVDKNDICLFLGDITERDTNPGDVIDQVAELFLFCSNHFSKTYVIMGNHDLKLFKERPQYSIKFLDRFENVLVIKDVTDIEMNGIKVRCLPFIRKNGININEYYSNYNWSDFEEADLTVGHWNKFNPKNKLMKGVDVSNMKTKMFCLGHIHTREDKDYPGSVFPNTYKEQGERVYKTFEKIGNEITVKETLLPTFLSYDTIVYPNKIEVTDKDIVHVYDVDNCKNLHEAESYYSNNFIRKVNILKINKKDEKTVGSSESFSLLSQKEAFSSFLEEVKYPLNRKELALIYSLL